MSIFEVHCGPVDRRYLMKKTKYELATLVLDLLAKGNTVPEGWKLVPPEPTDAMLAEVDEEVGGHCYSCSVWKASYDDCRRVYAAMLSAAPTPGETKC